MTGRPRSCSTSPSCRRRWYNIVPDLPTPPPPPLHPGTLQPVGPEDLAPLFPMDLIMQEVTDRARTSTSPARCSTSTGCGARRRCTARTGWRRRWTRRPGSTTSTRASPRPARTSRTPPCRRRTTTPKAGIRRLTTETGAGQWGTALAFACAQFGLECEVWQVRASYDQKPYRRMMMETFGGTVHPLAVRADRGRAGDPGRRPGLARLARHRDQRGGRGGGAERRHQLRAGQRAQPRAAAPDRHRRGGAAAAGEGRRDGPTSSSAAPAAARTSAAWRSRSCARSWPGGWTPVIRAVEPAACPSLTRGMYAYDFGDTAGMTPLMKMHTLGPRLHPRPDPRRRPALPRHVRR